MTKSRQYPLNKHFADKFSVRLEDMDLIPAGSRTGRLPSANPPKANPPRQDCPLCDAGIPTRSSKPPETR